MGGWPSRLAASAQARVGGSGQSGCLGATRLVALAEDPPAGRADEASPARRVPRVVLAFAEAR